MKSQKALDYLNITILTAVFTFLVFFRLGNAYAPETSYTVTRENRDIVLDFGDYIDISSMSVFL